MDFRSSNNINGLPPQFAGQSPVNGHPPLMANGQPQFNVVPDGVKPNRKTPQRSPIQMNHPLNNANAMDNTNAEHALNAVNEENVRPDE